MGGEKTNALAFLDDAAALEEILSAVYEVLAEWTVDIEMKTELTRLHREETNHALVIRTGKNYVRRAPEFFGTLIMPEKELEGGLEAARSVLDDIRSGDLDFREAMVCVRRLEDRFEKIHMATAMEIRDETLQKMFQQMARDDKDHRLTIDEALQKLG